MSTIQVEINMERYISNTQGSFNCVIFYIVSKECNSQRQLYKEEALFNK